MTEPARLAIVTSHPIQYQSPLFRRLLERGRIEPTVLYLSDHGLVPTHDPGFGRAVRFDVDLLEGFDYVFLRNRSPVPSSASPLSLVNPELLQAIHPRRFDAVLVHGHAHVSAWLSFLAALRRRVPYLLRGESHPLPSSSPVMKRVLKHAVLDPLVRGAAACLAIGRRNADFYRYHGAAEDCIVMAPYCVDNDYFSDAGRRGAAEREAVLKALGLDSGKPTILFAAKLIPRKRPLDVVAAHRLMKTDANLVVAGDGPLKSILAQSMGNDRSARLIGFQNQSELARWYGVADIFVVTSELERWGLTVNEAMAAGAVPVVSDVVGCAPDLVEPGAGRTFPVGDTQRLAQILDEVAADASLRARLGARARFLVDHHSLDAAAAGFERGIEMALAMSEGQPRRSAR